VLLIVEDLHWVDPSTLELLSLLIDQGAQARLCLLLTARPEFQPPWAMVAHVTSLTLQRFAPAQVECLATHVARDKALPPAVLQEMVRRADGVPLFVEELTKTVLESGLLQEREEHYELPGPLPPLAIPATLHDALMARLDRLGTAKIVAQLGATMGRTFVYDLLQAVAPLEATTLQAALAQLVEAEVVAQRGLPPQATYTFKHALIQDAAYQSLLRSTRQHYHQRITQVLEERFPDIVETQPELLAYHFTEAGLNAQAVPYWQRAGQRASARSAHVEAIAHFTKGLEVLATLPETPEQAQQELELQIALGPVVTATRGIAAPEVGKIYGRARELCQQGGESPQLFLVLWGLWNFYAVAAEFQTARELGEQLLILAQRLQIPAQLMEAHRALGQTFFGLGDLATARVHLEQSIALYELQQHRAHALRYGQDSGVGSLIFMALSLWWLGYPDQALQRMQEALTLARELAHPLSLAIALSFAVWLHQLRREGQAAQEQAEVLIALADQQGFPQYLGHGTLLRGSELVAQGQEEEGMAQMRQGWAAYQTTGARFRGPHFLALLAEACMKVQHVEEGLSALTEALTAVDDTGGRYYEAELYRLKGELLLVRDAPRPQVVEAEASFRQALALARRQQAKSLELRTAMSLSRLWQHQGQRQEAHDLLAPIYGWFTGIHLRRDTL
jgi:predicted ATPase